MSRISKSVVRERHDQVFADVMAATNSPSKAMIAAEPALAENKPYAKVKAQRMLKRTDVQEKIQNSLENMRPAALKNIKRTLTSDNAQLANNNAWKIVEHLRGTPVKRSISMNSKASIEDALFE